VWSIKLMYLISSLSMTRLHCHAIPKYRRPSNLVIQAIRPVKVLQVPQGYQDRR
jgi:hypothetical protein